MFVSPLRSYTTLARASYNVAIVNLGWCAQASRVWGKWGGVLCSSHLYSRTAEQKAQPSEERAPSQRCTFVAVTINISEVHKRVGQPDVELDSQWYQQRFGSSAIL